MSHIPWLDASKQAMNFVAMVEEAMRVYLADFQEIDSTSSQHKYVSRCGAFVVLTSSKIRVLVPNDLQILRLLISEHVSFCSLQVTHHTFCYFPMLYSSITQIFAHNSYYKCYIGMSANLSIH